MSMYERLVLSVAERAGVTVGPDSASDVRILNPAFYREITRGGSLGAGESYMAGHWECDNLPALIGKIADVPIPLLSRFPRALLHLSSALLNKGRRSRAFEVGEKHYDSREDVYEAMLDPYRQYSCGYWKEADDLAGAQRAKMDLICRKLHLEPGMRVLDVGCGWGGLARYMAENHGAIVDGVSVSRDQVAFAREFCKGLPVAFHLRDYRDMRGFGQFDRVVSVGMFEHVGPKNYRTFMEIAHHALRSGGLFLLHSIGALTKQAAADPWINKYIFPNGCLPSLSLVAKASQGLFVEEDFQNFGPYYARTLQAWHDNFMRAWPRLREHYSNEFRRMWEFYLLTCKGGFESRRLQLWQFVFSKKPTDVYLSAR